METLIKTKESVAATQPAFCLHFNLGRHDLAPARNMSLLVITNFRAAGSALEQKSVGRPHITRILENEANFMKAFDNVWTIIDPI